MHERHKRRSKARRANTARPFVAQRRRVPLPARQGPLTEARRVVEELHRCGHFNQHLAGRERRLVVVTGDRKRPQQ